MQVLVEPLPDGTGYRATTGGPLDASATGPTPEDAIGALERTVVQRLRNGAQIFTVSVPGAPTDLGPILAHAGRRVPDEERRLWREGVDEYRRQCDEELRRQSAGPDPAVGE
jgi:hypothetical protein